MTFNNSFNLVSVKVIFLFNNILLITKKVVGLPLFIWSKAKYLGLNLFTFTVLVLKYLWEPINPKPVPVFNK